MLIAGLKNLFDEVRKCEDVEVILQKERYPVRKQRHVQKEVDFLQEEHGLIISDDIMELMYLPAGLQLHWSFKSSQDNDDIPFFGGFYLSNITNLIESPRNKVNIASHIIENEGYSPEKQAVAANSVYFDTQLRDYGYDTAVILALSEANMSELWLFDRVYLVKLEISLKEYFEALFLTKGAYHWQYLFCSETDWKNVDAYKKTAILKHIEMLKNIFPDHNYSMIDERLKKLNTK